VRASQNMGGMIPAINDELNDLNDAYQGYLYVGRCKRMLSGIWFGIYQIITDQRTINILISIGVIICIWKILCVIYEIIKYIGRKIKHPIYQNQMKRTREQQQKSYEEKSLDHAKQQKAKMESLEKCKEGESDGLRYRTNDRNPVNKTIK